MSKGIMFGENRNVTCVGHMTKFARAALNINQRWEA